MDVKQLGAVPQYVKITHNKQYMFNSQEHISKSLDFYISLILYPLKIFDIAFKFYSKIFETAKKIFPEGIYGYVN